MSQQVPPRPSAPAAGHRASDSQDSTDLTGSIDLSEALPPKTAAPTTSTSKALRGASPDPAMAPASGSISLSGSHDDESGDISLSHHSVASKKSTSSKKDGAGAGVTAGGSTKPPTKPDPDSDDESNVSFSTQTSLSKQSPIKTPITAPTPKKTPKATKASASLDEDEIEGQSGDISFSTQTSLSKKSPPPKTGAAPTTGKAKKATEDGGGDDSDAESGDVSFSTITSARPSPGPTAANGGATGTAVTKGKEVDKKKAKDEDQDEDEDEEGSEGSASLPSTATTTPKPTPTKDPSKKEPTKKAPPGKAKASEDSEEEEEDEEEEEEEKQASAEVSYSSEVSSQPKKKPPTTKPPTGKTPPKAPASGSTSIDLGDGDGDQESGDISVASAQRPVVKRSESSSSRLSSSTVASSHRTSGTTKSKGVGGKAKAGKKPAAAASEYSEGFDEDEEEEEGEKSVSRSISLRNKSSKAGSDAGDKEESVLSDDDTASQATSVRSKAKGTGKSGAPGTSATPVKQAQTTKKGHAAEEESEGYSDDDEFVEDDDGEEESELDRIGGGDKVTPLKSVGSGGSRPASSANRPTSARPGARPGSAQPAAGARNTGSTGSITPKTHRSVASDDGNEDDDGVQNSMDEEEGPRHGKGKRAGAAGGSGDAATRTSGGWRPSSAVSKMQRTPSQGSQRRPVSANHEDSWEGEVRTPPGTSGQPPRGGRPYSGRSRESDGDGASSSGAGARPISASRYQRPSSAAPRMRQGAQVSDLARRHPTQWDVRDVCMWVESIGLGQYRKKFMHNIVDGRMLLMLTDDQMKVELGIGPMGHRVALLRAIESLLDEFEAAQGNRSPPRSAWQATSSRERPSSARPPSAARGRPPPPEHPRRPASASPNVVPPDRYLGPAAGKITVYEQRSKLLFELDRAAARAAQQKAIADQLAHTANLTEEEVLRLRALLQDLEHKNRMEVQHSSGALDSHSRIPWRPVGTGSRVNPNPERLARPGEDPSVDLTFKPRLSKETKRMFREQAANRASFLDRLETDLRKRDRNKKELDSKYYSAEALFQDPMLAKKEKDRDVTFLRDYFSAKNLLDSPLSERDVERDMQINEVVSNYAEGWKLKDKQVNAITSSKGDKKVKAMASAIRAMQFMQRYESELQQREDKLLTLQKKWWELSMGRPHAKEEDDRKQLVEYFGMLGWKGEGEEGVTEARLNALLARARAYKKEWEAWKERGRPLDATGEVPALVKWDEHPWTADGLGPLMESEMQRIKDAAESRPVPSSGKTVTTKHAGEGAVAVSQMVVGDALDYLTYTVKLLAGLRWDSLEKLEGFGEEKVKRLAVYRGIRTQKFLEFTENKIKERERSMMELYSTMGYQKKVITRQQQDGFFERLLDDSNKRRARVEKLLSEKMAKEKEILASTKLYARRTTR